MIGYSLNIMVKPEKKERNPLFVNDVSRVGIFAIGENKVFF